MKKIAPPLVVPKPCHAEWATMSGDERKRFCGECGKHVYNLSAMTANEAQKFADETQGSECVAYIRTEDGLMQSPNFFERLILRIAGWKPAFATALVAILPAALAGCVSRGPLPGIPGNFGKTTVPQEQAHQVSGEIGVATGGGVPVPGTPMVKPGKARLRRE